jgi:hypothetical protein
MAPERALDSQYAREAAAAAAFDSTLMWSRSAGLLSATGNADAELKTRVSDGAADDFRRLARELGMNTSELLRLLVLTRLYGIDGVARMTRSELERVAGNGPETVAT